MWKKVWHLQEGPNNYLIANLDNVGSMVRVAGSRKVVLLVFVAVFVLPFLQTAMGSEHKVDNSVETRLTVEGKDHDDFTFELDDGNTVYWYITLVTGDVLDIYLMTDAEHQKLDGGGSFVYFSQYSKDNTDFYEDQVAGSGTYVGKLALVVMSQGKTNSSSTYDIEVKVKKAPGPTNLLDMLCGLGVGICAVLLIGVVVVIVIIYYIWRRMAGPTRETRADVPKRGEEPKVRYVDSMMRPGFDIPISKEPQPKKPAPPRKKRHGPRTGPKGQVKAVTRPAKAVPRGRCPSCGERLDEGQGYCPSCGQDI